ncbi:MAG: osmoprotectant ABC transporter substrate-binding protein [Kurthia gibsonii]|uniref:Osmoprotectant ABC transporter substrate-binding protein n=1 Tax=Kurthia gibsonii TaxID=33946 RepID=A0ABU9LIZ6_9BACL|nr:MULTISPECIES: osmoprotectant ABC transporter substrate-binding protein [Kurthia]AMA62758.1 glycine betaine/carnitine/choline ABC transporter [Kurthia sp. 11kri321]MEB6113189.1 osmoprotectant ABC transporter substrate-binding protein [Kurthia gibsonii]RXH52716.1 osmoprotectant ABC transporter substrate-binding protein [Kurthia gibsonii]WIL38803.1 osmoprotectant ABC transporter substrate-binding protein [Kurthia sp. YJT4]GED19384.1 carnitine transport-binding protein OpuCC [Kurthia gibsonii]
MRRLKWIVFICSIMLILSACSSGKDETIKIATVTTTESAIMGNMVKLMIEHYTDENVQMINNLGSSVVVHQAMLNGDANISATRYTGTDLTGALGQEAIKDPEEAMKKVQELFQKDYDQTFFDSYGFANTYAFMVSKETAKKYNLKKVSDLRKVADKMQAGVDTSWMNRPGDGYKAFVKEYGFDFNKVYPMQIGLVYDAVEAGKMDVVLGYTTDGRISSYDLVVLEDDLKFFPPYDCSPLATNELLKTHPEVKKILEKLVDKVSTEEMQKLNYESDNNLLEPAVVAQRFLEKHNYFDDKGGE